MVIMSGITNGYIFDILRNKIKLSHLFVDIYSSNTIDFLKLQKLKNFIIICNLSPSYDPGSHFVTIIGTPKELLYLDSMALSHSLSSEIYATLLKFKRKIINLVTKRIQSVESFFCGYYCIYFCCLFDYDKMKIIKNQIPFEKNELQRNDNICMKNIQTLIKLNKNN